MTIFIKKLAEVKFGFGFFLVFRSIEPYFCMNAEGSAVGLDQ